MDLSALIFVALAAAWAVYLVPKALKHHEEDAVNRSVEGFSDQLRVVARREPVSASAAALVAVERPAEVVEAVVQPAAEPATRPTPVQQRLRRAAAARRAAERRRRVLTVLVLAIVAVVALATAGLVAPAWIAAPAAITVAWLVLCRVMVRRERAARAAAARARTRTRRRTLAEEVLADEAAADDREDGTDAIPAVAATADDATGTHPVDPAAWTPVPVPLPTYVAKAPAGRTIRTIDLDSTGVWSSGRNEIDTQLAREADAQRAARAETSDAEAEQRRAAGS